MPVYIGLGIAVLAAVLLALIVRHRQGVDREVYLVVRSGSQAGVRFRVEKARVVIGSQNDNDLVLIDDRISRHHLQVTYEHGAFVAVDLNSLYGTFADGERLEKRELVSGTILNLGKAVELEFSIVD